MPEEEEKDFLLQESIALNPQPKVRSEIKFETGERRKEVLPNAHDSIIRELLTSVPEEFVEVDNDEHLRMVDPILYKAKVKTLAEWNNITNLDAFLELVYEYYRERGHQQLVLQAFSSLGKLAFMIVFAAILAYAIDWSFISQPATAQKHPQLWQVMSLWNFFSNLSLFGVACLVVFGGFWGMQCARLLNLLPQYEQVARFYKYILEIEDSQLGFSVDFGEVCHRIHRFHEGNRVGCERLNEQDICNRIMRRDNYLIAMYNRGMFDFTKQLPSKLGNNQTLLTRILEWNINFGLLGFVFEAGRVRSAFLKTTQRDVLAAELKKRFQLLAIINLVLAPFVLVFIAVYYLFRYGEELYRSPNSVLQRQFSIWARWNVREFNELEHLLDRRLAAAHKPAQKYIDSVTDSAPYTALLKFTSFVAGSIVLVLLAVTVVNEDLLMHFELTPGKSVIWYLGLFGAILTISRAMTPTAVKVAHPDKQKLITEIKEHLHTNPEQWQTGKENSREALELLSSLFVPRYVLFIRELIGLITNPLVLYCSLAPSAGAFVEFVREFTVQSESLGYICTFAQFDLEQEKNVLLAARDAKLEKSILSFKSNNPHWQPTQLATSQFLSRLAEFEDETTIRHEKDESLLYSIEDRREELTASVISVLHRYRAQH